MLVYQRVNSQDNICGLLVPWVLNVVSYPGEKTRLPRTWKGVHPGTRRRFITTIYINMYIYIYVTQWYIDYIRVTMFLYGLISSLYMIVYG